MLYIALDVNTAADKPVRLAGAERWILRAGRGGIGQAKPAATDPCHDTDW